MEKACKSCRKIVEGDVCPACGSTSLTKTFEGYIIVLNPENSQVSTVINAKVPGKYALKIK